MNHYLVLSDSLFNVHYNINLVIKYSLFLRQNMENGQLFIIPDVTTHFGISECTLLIIAMDIN